MLQRSEKRCAFIQINLLTCHELLFYTIIKEQESALCGENKGDASGLTYRKRKKNLSLPHFKGTMNVRGAEPKGA